MEEMYFIQDSRTYHGNAVVWWREGGKGYTSNLAEAGEFTKAEAEKISNRKTDIPWRVGYILRNEKAIKKIIDMQYLSKEQSGIK